MAEFFVSMGNVLVDRSPDELIGAVIFALTLALAMSGIYYIGRRNLRENLMPIIVLMLIANLVSMAVGSGYVMKAGRKPLPGTRVAAHPVGGGSEDILVDTIFRTADRNGDGQLSPEEASVGAQQFVKHAAVGGSESIDSRSLVRAIVTAEGHERAWSRSRGDHDERATRNRFTLESEAPVADPSHAPAGPRPEHYPRADAAATLTPQPSSEPAP